MNQIKWTLVAVAIWLSAWAVGYDQGYREAKRRAVAVAVVLSQPTTAEAIKRIN